MIIWDNHFVFAKVKNYYLIFSQHIIFLNKTEIIVSFIHKLKLIKMFSIKITYNEIL